eukprot:1312692-Pleurochrysis_carterae.AAC.1
MLRSLGCYQRARLAFEASSSHHCACRSAQVLVHCLAGAHRAGTAGCLVLMHFHRLGYEYPVAQVPEVPGGTNAFPCAPTPARYGRRSNEAFHAPPKVTKLPACATSTIYSDATSPHARMHRLDASWVEPRPCFLGGTASMLL